MTFGLKRSSTKSKRTHKKFPRYKFKDFIAIPRNLKEWGYCKLLIIKSLLKGVIIK